jgi:predicted NAD/FAD-binding protein
MRIAIVGTGIAGLSSAHILGRSGHDVVVFEAADRLGGHANTVSVEDPVAGPIDVDTGFIVHNDRNYPLLTRLFNELDVPVQDSEMSFAVTDRSTGFHYRATSVRTLFADRRNLVDRRMWRMLFDIARFYRNAKQYLASGRTDLSMAEFLEAGRYGSAFVDLHLIPMGAAVWSADPTTFDRFPASSLLAFLDNHGLLGVGDRPQWRTVVGGSRRYVDALASQFGGEIRLRTAVSGITRTEHGVQLTSATGHELFDEVVVACHSDDALALLTDATPDEKSVLGAIGYQPNRATLHTDTSLLPPTPKAWAAWNYECGVGDAHLPAVTYDLTCLQRLAGSRRYLVSLNADDRIDPATVIASFEYSHPVFDRPAIEAQMRHDEISGHNHTHFCGAYWGYGFHEDGIASGVRVCKGLGVNW